MHVNREPDPRRLRTLEEVIAAHPFPFELELMQKQDIVKLAGWRRALGDLPVGYGKTCIGTAASLMLGPDLTVILVPPILIVQWVAWLKSVPGTGTVYAYTGSPTERKSIPVKTARWLVMSYAIFRNDLDRLGADTHEREVLTIVDEAQNLKNSTSLLFKGVKSFSANRDLFLMSGTIMSKPADAYAYISLTTPGAYHSLRQFENIHVAERDFFEQPIEWHNLDLLNANLNARRVYRTKEEVHAALPKANFIPIYYDLSKEHMALYQRLMTEQLLELESSGEKIDATTAQRLYHAAQQIISNYGYFADDETKRGGVFDLIDEVCDQISLGAPGSSKLILWTTYKRTSAAVQAYMQQKLEAITTVVGRKKLPAGYRSVAAYSGANSKKSVAEFLEDPYTVNLTAQPGSAGAGLNPQHLCWECAFVETPTTTIPFIQSSGRIDRKGQKYRPNIRLFIARGTIQEKLLANLISNDELVQKSSGSLKGIKSLIFPS